MPVADELTRWTEIGAIGTLALAGATVLVVGGTIWLAVTDRRRDDAKREEDRVRDDRLRREAADEWERRTNAERWDREDYEARQVLVTFQEMPASFVSRGDHFSHRVTVNTPRAFPIKQVAARIAGRASNANLSILPLGHAGDDPFIEEDRICFGFWAVVPEQLDDAAPIVRFVDRHGNLYYQLKNHNRRFPQNTEFISAASDIDLWIRTGPNPTTGPEML
jgi:hypothetical protein